MRRTFWVVIGSICMGLAAGQLTQAIAQAVTAGNPPIASDIWNTLLTSGPLATLLGFILWRVDSERRQLQRERDGLIERVLMAIVSVTQSTKDVATTANSLLQALQSLTEVVRDKGK